MFADVTFDAGADFRVRQEISENIPGLPGNSAAMMPKTAKDKLNHLRFRPRAWMRTGTESFGLYLRFAEEFREHVVDNGVPFKDRAYAFPDEAVIDNLYFEGLGLWDGLLDFRIGRQDLFDGRGSVFGLDRLVLDGAAYVGSRSCYADMARFTIKPTKSDRIDVFALYDAGHNALRWGNDLSDKRPMNAIHPADSDEMDEWGGGIVWHGGADGTPDAVLPFRLYAVEKKQHPLRPLRRRPRGRQGFACVRRLDPSAPCGPSVPRTRSRRRNGASRRRRELRREHGIRSPGMQRRFCRRSVVYESDRTAWFLRWELVARF